MTKVTVTITTNPVGKCDCEMHLRKEAAEPNKPWIPCIGHGEGCPCTEKLKNENQKGSIAG